MGTTDKIIRITLAALAVVLYFLVPVKGILGIVLLVIAGTLVLTSLISFCPLYPVLGINTGKKKE